MEISLLVIYQSLRLFVNTLTVDDKYFLCNGENLLEVIQMQLSKKQKNVFWISNAFVKFTSDFKYFERKDYPHSLRISEITDGARRG